MVSIANHADHPLVKLVDGRKKTGTPLAINGVFGNLGVASAALVTGIFIDTYGWHIAFYVLGIVSVFIGILYWVFIRLKPKQATSEHNINKRMHTDCKKRRLFLAMLLLPVMRSVPKIRSGSTRAYCTASFEGLLPALSGLHPHYRYCFYCFFSRLH